MTSLLPLSFYFTTKDSDFKTTTVVVQDTPRYISHSFVETPIYDFSDKKIGYKVSDDYVQASEPGKYIVRLNNTYYIDKKGSISWLYVFENNKPEIYYPVNVQAASTIISGTGEYFGKTGTVTLFPKPDGTRLVTISFTP
jgi:hypothetical protein